MAIIRFKLSDFTLSTEGDSALTLTANDVLDKLRFLPKPTSIEIEGDEAVLHFPDESETQKEEAKRLAKRAGSRAQEGNYDKAVGILQRALGLDPLLISARRDLAMVYVEMGRTDEAVNHLIEVLRLDPKDGWSWVVLANLYINQKHDEKTGQQFLERALEVNPNDSWALNSLGALTREQGDLEKAIELFEKAIEANPHVGNPYYGEAVALSQEHKLHEATDVLKRMFQFATKPDVRSAKLFDEAHTLFTSLQGEFAQENLESATRIVRDYTEEIEQMSGYPVRFAESEFEETKGVGASMQMAWKKARNYHFLQTRKGYPEALLPAIEAHELTHVRLEALARKSGTNRWFTTTKGTRERAMLSMSTDLKKLRREGYAEQSIAKVTNTLIEGLSSFLYNCPLDMIIEREIHSRFPELRPAQYLSVSLMANESRAVNEHPKVRAITPKKVFHASLALNGAYGLFIDSLFEGATEFARFYEKESTFASSRYIYEHCMSRLPNLDPGEEYDVVDEIADMLDLRDWYEWQEDTNASNENERQESDLENGEGGVTNPSLLRAKAPAGTLYFINIFRRFEKLSIEEIKEIGFEIALLGQHGIDFTNANDRYNLRTISGEKFTGLQLMCLMYASFKEFEPSLDTGIDLGKEYELAKQIHEAES